MLKKIIISLMILIIGMIGLSSVVYAPPGTYATFEYPLGYPSITLTEQLTSIGGYTDSYAYALFNDVNGSNSGLYFDFITQDWVNYSDLSENIYCGSGGAGYWNCSTALYTFPVFEVG